MRHVRGCRSIVWRVIRGDNGQTAEVLEGACDPLAPGDGVDPLEPDRAASVRAGATDVVEHLPSRVDAQLGACVAGAGTTAVEAGWRRVGR